jgi:hypothetical protein
MILKLSDLQRSLDQSLATTHGQSRIYVIIARYCAEAGEPMANNGCSPSRTLIPAV